MKRAISLLSITVIPLILLANDSDWSDDSWQNESKEEITNSTFDKVKIKNRSKKEYDDKVYKYITGDYKVKNNTVELANIELDNKLQNNDIEVNIHVENLKVEGDSYKDSIDIKRNQYKNFVKHDEISTSSLEDDNSELDIDEINTVVKKEDIQYEKVPDEDVSELETIDLKNKHDIKEVNVFIEDVNIIVD